MLTQMHFDAGKVTGFFDRFKLKKIRIFSLISTCDCSKTRTSPIFILSLLLIFICSTLSGQNETADTLKKKFALFESEELLDIYLKFDLSTFLKKNPKTGYQDAMLIIPLSATDTIDRKVKIKPRGEYRQQTCSFPPIMLNFKKLFPAYSDTGKINKLKLVTHCQPGPASDENVLREYLVYKLFNVLTDTSYRVRLLRVNYIDTGKDRKPITQYGFFIEPIEILALRTNSSVANSKNLTQRAIAPGTMDRAAIFFYMIAQWDWSVPGLHNVSVIVPSNYAGTGLGVAIPFDFDLSGVVNPSYGTPDVEKMGISSNRDRIFNGICRSKEEYQSALEEFKIKKESFYSVVNDFPYLSPRSKKDIIGFLDQFLNQLDNQKNLDRLISLLVNTCKKL